MNSFQRCHWHAAQGETEKLARVGRPREMVVKWDVSSSCPWNRKGIGTEDLGKDRQVSALHHQLVRMLKLVLYLSSHMYQD